MEQELPRRKNTRLQGYDYNTPGAYFLTLCTENRKCVLSRIVGTGVLDGPNIELYPYGKIVEKYIRQMSNFYDHLLVESYVIMPNHIHILLRVFEGPSGTPVPTSGGESVGTGLPDSPPAKRPEKGPSRTPVPTNQNSEVSRFVSTLKRFCNKECGKNIWQYRSYDHVIRDQRDFDKHLKYIYENPFKWEKDELYLREG